MSDSKKRKRHSPEQVIAKLREADAMLAGGGSVGQTCQCLGVREQTLARWRNRYGGMKSGEAKRLKELGLENARLQADRGGPGVGPGDAQGTQRGKMVSPTHRREAVDHLQRVLHVTERRACRVVGQPRSSQRYRPRKKGDGAVIVKRMHEPPGVVRCHPRFGYRRIHTLLVRGGRSQVRGHVERLVRESVEQTLNGLLEAETAALCGEYGILWTK